MSLPPKPSGSDYADSVRDVLEHAARTDEATSRRQSPKSTTLARGPVVLVVAVVFAGVLYYNVRSFSRPPAPLPPEAAEVSAGITVMIATQAVEAYRDEHGRLPASLDELGFPTEGLEYRVDGDSYELTVSEGETTLQFSPEEGPTGILEEMGITVTPPPPPGGQP